MKLLTRHMRYFVAVAEELNFHRAADRLNMTQPALWRQIRDLEAGLGATLLHRDGRAISLTAAGVAFLEDCGDILERMERTCQRVRGIADGQTGTLNIAFNEIAGRREELPRFLRAFGDAFPGVSIQLQVLMSQSQVEALRGGSVDAGFLFRRRGDRSDFRTCRIAEDDYAVALPRDHPLARKPALVLADLAGEPLIMPNPRTNGAVHDRFQSAFRKVGVAPLISQFADNENAIINLVSAGMGLAFLNISCRLGEGRGVVLRPIPDLSMPLDLELAWMATNPNPALANFVSLVVSLVGDHEQMVEMMETGMG